MAIKKNQLYSQIWDACDALRGGMEASQYKDYILSLLFVKYVSDKAKEDTNPLYEIPEGAGFDDMLKYRGDKDIGDRINTILTRLSAVNRSVDISFPDFNDEKLLGKGKELVDRVTKLLEIFNNDIDLGKNRAEDDDLLGDAYEYLMRQFATKSGQSKGQFYTPAEVSRLLAFTVGINSDTRPQVTLYDPTCGSGSLLLRAVASARTKVSVHGQEDVATTADLARMNMFLHGQDTAIIRKGNTLSDPLFKEGNQLVRRFDYVVANPPFSVKNWTSGFSPQDDVYHRFEYGVPPKKCGDYAFLQHIIASMKVGIGRAACIMPHGVLFRRNNAEAAIRKKIIEQGYIEAIIGLPANLFYGTQIAACVLVLDKKNAPSRTGIFTMDASKGYMKDGNMNRLREQDVRRIIDTFTARIEKPGYSRMVPIAEIRSNDYNLSIPLYIEKNNTDIQQDIFAHLNGGIPQTEIDAMSEFREVFPKLKDEIFGSSAYTGYRLCRVDPADIHGLVKNSAEYKSFRTEVISHINTWQEKIVPALERSDEASSIDDIIDELGNSILAEFEHCPLLDKYCVYQRLVNYLNDTLKDDLYFVQEVGWKAVIDRKEKTDKKGRTIITSWSCDLLPKEVVSSMLLPQLCEQIANIQSEIVSLSSDIEQMEEDQTSSGGYLGEEGNASVKKRLTELRNKCLSDEVDELKFLEKYNDCLTRITELKKKLKSVTSELDAELTRIYVDFTHDQVRDMVVHNKWLGAIRDSILEEAELRVRSFSSRIKELVLRYETPLTVLQTKVDTIETRVQKHLSEMGFTRRGARI